jgi:hypothetical protein
MLERYPIASSWKVQVTTLTLYSGGVTMLYIIGGASRSGKTTTAKRILKEANTPYFH